MVELPDDAQELPIRQQIMKYLLEQFPRATLADHQFGADGLLAIFNAQPARVRAEVVAELAADPVVTELRELWQAALEREGNLASAVADVIRKAAQFGSTEDGDAYAYIVPKGCMHRLVGVVQQNGAHVPVAFRNSTELFSEADAVADAVAEAVAAERQRIADGMASHGAVRAGFGKALRGLTPVEHAVQVALAGGACGCNLRPMAAGSVPVATPGPAAEFMRAWGEGHNKPHNPGCKQWGADDCDACTAEAFGAWEALVRAAWIMGWGLTYGVVRKLCQDWEEAAAPMRISVAAASVRACARDLRALLARCSLDGDPAGSDTGVADSARGQ